MHKKKKKLIVLIVLLVLLSAALVFLLQDNKKEQSETENAENLEKTPVTLCEQEISDITGIRIQGQAGEVDIVNENGNLVLQNFENYEQSQVKMQMLFQRLSKLTGMLVMEQDFDKERYGFSDNGTSVEIQGQENVTLYLGDYNEAASGWYLMRADDKALYTIDAAAGKQIEASPYSYLDTTFIQAYQKGEVITDRLRKIQIERPDMEETLVIEALDEEQQAYTSMYEITSPVHVKTSLKSMNEEIGSLFGLSADQALGRYTPDQAKKYGFENPAMVMTVEHDGRTDVFTIGDKTAEGSRYLLWSGTDLLYTIAENRLSLLDEDVNSLFFGIAILPEIDRVDSVELTIDDKQHLFILERDTNGEISGVMDQGQEIDEKLFRKFYSFLLEVDVQEVWTEQADGKPRLGITYHYREGGEDTIEVKLLEDGRTAGIFVNGKMSFKGRIAYVEKLKTELAHLLAGETIDTNW